MKCLRVLSLFLLWFASVALGAGEVKLYSSMNVKMSKYGRTWQQPEIRVLVKNLAVDKVVTIVARGAETGEIISTEARYVQPAFDGYEVWEAVPFLNGEDYVFHVEYNVAGRFYQTEDQALKIGPVFYSGQNVQLTSPKNTFYGESVYFAVAVRNLAYQKRVRIHYSLDKFFTVKEVDLSFANYYGYGYGYFYSPTPDGLEMWTGMVQGVPADVKDIDFYVSYDVAGKRYYDNNFGRNYRLTRYQ